MALINIATVITDTKRAFKKSTPPGGIELLSYKRDRSITIINKKPGIIEIREHGYKDQSFEITVEQLTKKLKPLIKREFPRSRKIRLNKFSNPQQLQRTYPEP